jgi:hypothetical protein
MTMMNRHDERRDHPESRIAQDCFKLELSLGRSVDLSKLDVVLGGAIARC